MLLFLAKCLQISFKILTISYIYVQKAPKDGLKKLNVSFSRKLELTKTQIYNMKLKLEKNIGYHKNYCLNSQNFISNIYLRYFYYLDQN